MSSFTEIATWLKSQFKSIDQQVNLRERKIHTEDVFYLMCLLITKKCSYQEAVTSMRVDEFIDKVSAQAFNNRILSGQYVQPFYQLIHQFTEKFICSPGQEHIYAVDGSKFNILLTMIKYGFKKFKNRPYTTGLISVLFDLKYNIPVEFQLSTVLDERTLFFNQLTQLKMPNEKPDNTYKYTSDIFIFDRGYYSEEMVNKIYSLFQNCIFRVKNNLRLVKQLDQSGSDDMITNLNGRQMRIVKYTLQTPPEIHPKNSSSNKIVLRLKNPICKRKMATYYLITSLTDVNQYPVSKLKELYHRRWSVEEYYKKIKRNFISGTFHSRCMTSLETELLVQQLINLLTRYFLNHIEQYEKYPVNQKITNNIIIEKILPIIIYKSSDTAINKKINNILSILGENVVPIRPGRSFKRIKLLPISKHIYQENKYSSGHRETVTT